LCPCLMTAAAMFCSCSCSLNSQRQACDVVHCLRQGQAGQAPAAQPANLVSAAANIVAGSIGTSLQLLPSMQMHSPALLGDSSSRLSSSFSHMPRSSPGYAAAGSAAIEAP
jgi:hypothetical protein